MNEQSETESEPTTALQRLRTDPVSRRRFIQVGGVGTAGALAAFVAACGGDDDGDEPAPEPGETTTAEVVSEFGEGDLGIVNYALTLEYLEADFYDAVEKAGLFKGDEAELIKIFGANERAHIVALEGTAKQLGTPAPKPKTEFGFGDPQSVLETAVAVENLGAAAYLGQAARIQSDEILAAALAIHSVEARHAATLSALLGEDVAPDGAFAVPRSMEEVLPELSPFIVG